MADSVAYDFLTLNGDEPQAPPPSKDAANVTVATKLPKFWKDAPKEWFDYAEAVFAKRNIDGNLQKITIMLAALDDDCVRSVVDLATSNPQYDSIKERLMNLHSAPEFTRSPSQLLSDMRAAFPDGTSETTLKECWLRKLPPAILPAVSGLDGPLHEMAENAEGIWYATSSGHDDFDFSADDNFHRWDQRILTLFVGTSLITFALLMYIFYCLFLVD